MWDKFASKTKDVKPNEKIVNLNSENNDDIEIVSLDADTYLTNFRF